MTPPNFGGSYDANTLKLLGQVFDEIWQSIAGNYGSPLTIEAARTNLANIILSLSPTDGPLDAERVKYGALVAMGHKESAADSFEQVRADIRRETWFYPLLK